MKTDRGYHSRTMMIMTYVVIALAVMVHAAIALGLLRMKLLVKREVEVARLPDWIAGQMEKTEQRAHLFELLGVSLIILGVLFERATSGAQDYLSWRLGVASFVIAFQVGAFLIEGISIQGGRRLLAQVGNRNSGSTT
jgi:hypothetical protein